MRSVIKNYIGMIAIAVVAVLIVGALAVRIDREQTPDIPAGIQATPAISGNAPDLLVDTRWLLKYQSQVDYIFDLGDIRLYDEGHIPGARHIWWQDAMRLHAANYGEPDAISNESNPDDVFGNLHLNVPQNSVIVLYDANNSERASWLLWIMKMNGYTDVYVLDGGLQAWMGAGGELSTETVAAPADPVVATPTMNGDLVWNREQMLETISDPNMHLVDTRSATEQLDTVNGTIREGHILGAVNITTSDVMNEDGTFRSPYELQALFASHGIERNQQVVVYSLFSKDSGPVWLALKIAGYENAAIYQEGFVAWGYNAELPLDPGPFPTPLSPGTPEATPVSTPASTPVASPEDGPTDLTGD